MEALAIIERCVEQMAQCRKMLEADKEFIDTLEEAVVFVEQARAPAPECPRCGGSHELVGEDCYTEAEMETAVHMGGIVESFLCGEHVEVDSMELRSMVPSWAREFEAKYAGQQWGEDDGPEFYEALDTFMDEKLEPWAKGDPDA